MTLAWKINKIKQIWVPCTLFRFWWRGVGMGSLAMAVLKDP
jgi:hypothetical protein